MTARRAAVGIPGDRIFVWLVDKKRVGSPRQQILPSWPNPLCTYGLVVKSPIGQD